MVLKLLCALVWNMNEVFHRPSFSPSEIHTNMEAHMSNVVVKQMMKTVLNFHNRISSQITHHL